MILEEIDYVFGTDFTGRRQRRANRNDTYMAVAAALKEALGRHSEYPPEPPKEYLSIKNGFVPIAYWERDYIEVSGEVFESCQDYFRKLMQYHGINEKNPLPYFVDFKGKKRWILQIAEINNE